MQKNNLEIQRLFENQIKTFRQFKFYKPRKDISLNQIEIIIFVCLIKIMFKKGQGGLSAR